MTPDQILARMERALERRRPYESTWKDAYDHVLPRPGQEGALFDATAADAAEQLAASLLAELTPPWSRWFGLAPSEDTADTPEGQATAFALEGTARALQRELDRSNFAIEMHQAFLDLVVTGIAARLLGATYGRLQTELLTPMIARCLAILARRGEVPPVLLDGSGVRLCYESPLARVQGRADAANTLLFLDAVGKIGGTAAAQVDAASATRWLARTLGAPAEILVPAPVEE
ncbi:portal protein [Rhodovarius lipocyclicus]|uniref:portal protein n=1 Tax=Rhodovarius lipocyclicus TaxID=268410 RepID=UPI0013583841|nr:portal protein [Rhodovarius lipocyclicus]